VAERAESIRIGVLLTVFQVVGLLLQLPRCAAQRIN
jgi:hypothetical protein